LGRSGGKVPQLKKQSQSGGRAPQSKKAKRVRHMDDLRIRLIERLCRLPSAHLADVEALLGRLEGNGAATPKTSAGSSAPTLTPHKSWPHAPVHCLSEHGTYIVTASTLRKQHFFRGQERLPLLEDALLELAKEHGVILEAWAVFSNHYHFVAHTTGVENQLANLIARLHYDTAEEINRRDGSPGRQVWFNYWDKKLTFEKSYLARLSYVHQNAVKHGLAARAGDYPWCSAPWLEQVATRAQVATIYSFKTDRVKVEDDYEPVL
jgi:putative transposase